MRLRSAAAGHEAKTDNSNMKLLVGVLDSGHQDGFQYLYTGSSTLDLINFGGNLSLELFRLGHTWQETLRKVKLRSLVVLLGAGGVILYLIRRSRPRTSWPGQGEDPIIL